MNAQNPPAEISIVLVNYKTSELTMECVQSLYDFAPQVPFEVLVIDNASDDGLAERLAESFPDVRYFAMGENVGFAKANNFGIHNSHGRYVMLLNNDAKFTDGALQKMIDCMEAMPGVGVLGPRHVDADGFFQVSCGAFPTLMTEAVRKLIHYRLSLNDYRVRDYLDQKYSGSPAIGWLSGSCLLIRREALEQAGLLDERFFMYFEDVDFCHRVSGAGWVVHYYSHVTVTHYGGASAKQNLLSAMIENRRSQIYFSRKYYGRKGEAFIRAALFLKYGVNLLRWTSIWGVMRLWGIQDARFYTLALLAKKVIFLVLEPVSPHPRVPCLSRTREAPAQAAPPSARLTKK